eukprot:9698677-Prorocentrum_lima.AAC.1
MSVDPQNTSTKNGRVATKCKSRKQAARHHASKPAAVKHGVNDDDAVLDEAIAVAKLERAALTVQHF